MGVLFLFLEVFFLPGTTITGVIGLLLLLAGVYFVFKDYDSAVGYYSLTGVTLVTVVLISAGFKSGVWKKTSVKEVISGKVKLVEDEKFNIGDLGVAVSDIRPSGKALINNDKIEVHSMGGKFIEKNSNIEVIQVQRNKILVQLKA